MDEYIITWRWKQFLSKTVAPEKTFKCFAYNLEDARLRFWLEHSYSRAVIVSAECSPQLSLYTVIS